MAALWPLVARPWLGALLFSLLLPTLRAEPSLRIDVPAGPAAATLKTFATQTGGEILFSPAVVAGVQTRAVQGVLLPREALRRMLARTRLTFHEDADTGALLIKPHPSEPRPPATPPANAPDPTARMKSLPVKTLVASLFSLLVASSIAAEGDPAPAKLPVAETLKLDPFVVRADEHNGYSATSTLAGTRLNTALRDVGASISIVTPQFMQDVAATNLGELLSLTGSTEVGGVSGNFAGGTISSGRPDQSEGRENPQANNRVRGIGPATITRDYFVTDIPFDSYNTSGVTISRGPNSLLFGIGNPSGIIEGSLIHPLLQRNRTQVGTRFGSENSYRGTLDVNRVLVQDRVALRLASVYEKNNYQQEPAFDRKRRAFGTLEAVLRTGKQSSWLGKTSFRASGEMGDAQSNPVNVIPPVNSMLNFFELPNPAIANIPGANLDPRLIAGSPTFAWAPRTTIDNRTNSPTLVAKYPGVGTQYFVQIPLIFAAPGQTQAGYGGDNPALADIAGMMGRIRWTRAINGRDPTDLFYSATPTPIGFVAQTLQNPDIFDYRHRLLSGHLNRIEQKFQAVNFAATQQLFDGKGGLEIAYDQQRTQSTRVLPFSFGDNGNAVPGAAIAIDLSQYLPNDQPNPNVGRPFVTQQGITDRTTTGHREAYRATAFYRLNLEERGVKFFGLPLGNHIFTGLYTSQRNNSTNQGFATGWTSATRNLNTDVFQSTIGANFRTTPVLVQYLAPSVASVAALNDVRITNVVDARLPQSGDTYNVTFFDFTNKRLATERLGVLRFLNSETRNRQVIDSQSLSVKSDFFQNNLVSVVGWRWDQLKSYSVVGNVRNADDTLNTTDLRLSSTPNLSEQSRSLTWSVVGRLPRSLTKNLPLGLEIGGFYNTSGNFNPANIRTNLKGDIIPAPAGTTKEYGLLFEFLDRRISLRTSWFSTQQANSSNNAQGATAGLYGLTDFMLTRYLAAQTQGIAFNTIPGVVEAGYSSYEQLYNVLLQLHPEPTRTLKNLRINDTRTAPLFNSLAGLTDTSDLDARGLEIELVGNVTKRLRLSANVTKQETVVSNSAVLTKQIADETYANIVKFNLLGIDQGPALPERQTFRARFASEVGNRLAATLARDGAVSPEQRKWRANLTSTYDLSGFENPILKAMSIGASVRWQGKVAIGSPFLTGQALKEKIAATNKLYPNAAAIADNDPIMQSQFPDLAHAFYGPDELAGDWWLTYQRKIFRNIVWRLQLNVRNAWGNGEDIPVTANPDGSVAVIRIPNETRWLLSNSFSF